jgi:N-acetylmuramoyl-L-alanine amidase
MVKALFERIKQSAVEQYKQMIFEAQNAEDDDLMQVEPVPEQCPICEDESELIEWIAKQPLSRRIQNIVIHCTATRTDATVSAIQRYWRNNLGWKNPGYHIIFHHSGGFTVVADLDVVCNGVKGHNSNSVHLSYIGGIDAAGKPIDNRSESQKRLMSLAVKELRKKIATARTTQGHRDFPNVRKSCPCFDAKKEFAI